MIDYNNISFPLYTNLFNEHDYSGIIRLLREGISEYNKATTRSERDRILEKIAKPIIIFYSEWYRRDYTGGKGSQQWEEPLTSKLICTKDEYSSICTKLKAKVKEVFWGMLGVGEEGVDSQLLRSLFAQGGLPIEYIIHGAENSNFFRLLSWIINSTIKSGAPSIEEIKNKAQSLNMSDTLTDLSVCHATRKLSESIIHEAELPFNISNSQLIDLEARLKNDRERIKRLGLNKPVFLKEHYIKDNGDGNYSLWFKIHLEESVSHERAYQFGISKDTQKFIVSFDKINLGRYIKKADGLFHLQNFPGNNQSFPENDDMNENAIVLTDEQSKNSLNAELFTRFSFTGENIILTEFINGTWAVKARHNENGYYFVWIPTSYRIEGENGTFDKCLLEDSSYYRLSISSSKSIKIYSPDDKLIDPYKLFLTDYSVLIKGDYPEWLLSCNYEILTHLPDDNNIEIFNETDSRERKYAIMYRRKNDKKYIPLSDDLPEGVVYIRVDVGYQQVEKKFFFAKGLSCIINNGKQEIKWNTNGICKIKADLSYSNASISESTVGLFSISENDIIQDLRFVVSSSSDSMTVTVPVPINTVRVVTVDGEPVTSGRYICIPNLDYYYVYSPNNKVTRIFARTTSRTGRPIQVDLSRHLGFRTSLRDFKKDIETLYYLESFSHLDTNQYITLSFPDSGLSLKCCYYNRLLSFNEDAHTFSIINTGYVTDPNINTLNFIKLDCDSNEISIGQLFGKNGLFDIPSISGCNILVYSPFSNINLLRPTLIPLDSSATTDWYKEIHESSSPNDKVWEKLHTYYSLSRQHAIPFDIFNCFQALCGKNLKDFNGSTISVCPQEEYKTLVSRFVLTLLCNYNEPVDELLLSFARSFNFMWHWIDRDVWGKTIFEWGQFNPDDAMGKISQLFSAEICIPLSQEPMKINMYYDDEYYDVAIPQLSFGEIMNGSKINGSSPFRLFLKKIGPAIENIPHIHGPQIDFLGDNDIVREINSVQQKGERQLLKVAYVSAMQFSGRDSRVFKNPKAVLYITHNSNIYTILFTNILSAIESL